MINSINKKIREINSINYIIEQVNSKKEEKINILKEKINVLSGCQNFLFNRINNLEKIY